MELLCKQVAGISDLVNLGLLLGYALLEAWLGKTKRTESGSLVELLFRLAARAVKRGCYGSKDGH